MTYGQILLAIIFTWNVAESCQVIPIPSEDSCKIFCNSGIKIMIFQSMVVGPLGVCHRIAIHHVRRFLGRKREQGLAPIPLLITGDKIVQGHMLKLKNAEPTLHAQDVRIKSVTASCAMSYFSVI